MAGDPRAAQRRAAQLRRFRGGVAGVARHGAVGPEEFSVDVGIRGRGGAQAGSDRYRVSGRRRLIPDRRAAHKQLQKQPYLLSARTPDHPLRGHRIQR